jgi:hypothetical protein
MDIDKIKKVELSLENLKNKECTFYFLVQDTKGNAKASIRYTYQMAKVLKDNGYKTCVIHEKDDYTGVSGWLDSEFMDIKHESIENQNLKVSPEDFIIIPELYGHVMEQLSSISCGKIVLSQSYDYILETLKPGESWADNKFFKCITTTESQKQNIKNLMSGVNIDVINPYIPEKFSKKDKPSKPIVSIHTRDQRDTMKIIKTFYLKYPQYRWITFRDMRGLNQDEFSTYLKDSFVSIWIDDISSFGTFPIESMISNTPVIGKIPHVKPEWMNEDNGIWTTDVISIPDILSEFIQNWLEDNINDELYEKSYLESSKYQDYDKFTNSIIDVFNSYIEIRKENFESQLEKIKESEEQV